MPTLPPSDLPLPTRGGFHRPYIADRPEINEDPKLLHTLAYCDLIEAIAEVLFPENELKRKDGSTVVIKARDVRGDRYVLFRATWDPVFGSNLQLALMDFTTECEAINHGKHFVLLDAATRLTFMESLSRGNLTPWTSARRNADPVLDQKALFEILYRAITGALFGEPGYGGNYRGLGWYYANFNSIP